MTSSPLLMSLLSLGLPGRELMWKLRMVVLLGECGILKYSREGWEFYPMWIRGVRSFAFRFQGTGESEPELWVMCIFSPILK